MLKYNYCLNDLLGEKQHISAQNLHSIKLFKKCIPLTKNVLPRKRFFCGLKETVIFMCKNFTDSLALGPYGFISF